MKTIVVANQKGGVGKTTLATNLAVALNNKGKSILLDADEQQSAFKWANQREDIKCIAVHSNLLEKLEELDNQYEYILIDVAGRDSQIFREALLISDKLIIPTQPSLIDLEVLEYVSEKVAQAHENNSDIQSIVIINKAPTNYRNSEIGQAQAYIGQFQNLTLLNTIIHDRKAFRDSFVESLSVSEMSDAKANDELQQFLSEIL